MVHYREVSFWLEALMVEGTPCKTCARQVMDRLRSLEGVIAVRLVAHPADATLAVLIVKIHPDYVAPSALAGLLEGELGFPVREIVGVKAS